MLMRALLAGLLALFSIPLFTPTFAPALAQESCRCKGCGCKGGPGWRGPDGYCVSKAKLVEICGSPQGTPCIKEAAERVCFGQPASPTVPEATQ